MSFGKNDQIMTSAIAEEMITFLVQKILRQEYKNQTSAVKRIGQKTGIEIRTIRNWYEGKKAPKSAHLLILTRYYPQLLQEIIKLVGDVDLWTSNDRVSYPSVFITDARQNSTSEQIYSARSCTINVTFNIEMSGKLNQRQLWFLGLLQQGYKTKTTDIVSIWGVSARAAKYDIEGLVALNLIHFTGPRKTGRYAIVDKQK